MAIFTKIRFQVDKSPIKTAFKTKCYNQSKKEMNFYG